MGLIRSKSQIDKGIKYYFPLVYRILSNWFYLLSEINEDQYFRLRASNELSSKELTCQLENTTGKAGFKEECTFHR